MSVSQLPNHSAVNLEFKGLCYSVRDTSSKKYGANTKQILKNVSGIFKPGELTAIMGPSGAGKSTLMNILAGYKTQDVNGSVSVNGKRRDLAQFRKMSCYIMQDDVLQPNLTVNEAMKYAARLKLPSKTTKEGREQIIDEILEKIGLMECKNVRTANVSGGERKRLAIALELINNPPVMFFDEPVSGIDSSSCYNCVTLLKSLARDGRTIIATIHQPSARIFEQFDSLYLLGGGQCLYRGLVKSVVPYFSMQGLQCPLHENPANFAIDISSGFYGQQWISVISKAVYLSSESDSDSNGVQSSDKEEGFKSFNELAINSKLRTGLEVENGNKDAIINLITRIPGGLKRSFTPLNLDEGRLAKNFNEFLILLQRSFVCICRDRTLTHLRFGACISVGLIMGATFYDVGNKASHVFNNCGLFYLALVMYVLSSIMIACMTFPMERDVLIREHLNYWFSLKTYYLARTIAELPFQLLYPTLTTAMVYFMTGQPPEAFRFLIVLTMNIMMSLVAQSTGLLIGAAVDLQTAVFLGPMSAVPLFIFGGFGNFSLDGVPFYVRWMSYFSYPRYAFQVSLTALYGYDRELLECSQPFCLFKNPVRILEQMGVPNVNILEQTCILFSFVLVSQILGYYSLKCKIMAEKQ